MLCKKVGRSRIQRIAVYEVGGETSPCKASGFNSRPRCATLEPKHTCRPSFPMDPLPPPLAFFLLLFSGWINRQQQAVIDYLSRGEPDPPRGVPSPTGWPHRRPATPTSRERRSPRRAAPRRRRRHRHPRYRSCAGIVCWSPRSPSGSEMRRPGRPSTAPDLAALGMALASLWLAEGSTQAGRMVTQNFTSWNQMAAWLRPLELGRVPLPRVAGQATRSGHGGLVGWLGHKDRSSCGGSARRFGAAPGEVEAAPDLQPDALSLYFADRFDRRSCRGESECCRISAQPPAARRPTRRPHVRSQSPARSCTAYSHDRPLAAFEVLQEHVASLYLACGPGALSDFELLAMAGDGPMDADDVHEAGRVIIRRTTSARTSPTAVHLRTYRCATP